MVLGTWWGWGDLPTIALSVALAIAFVLTVPVNYWLISRGRGHAVVHGMHQGPAHDHSH